MEAQDGVCELCRSIFQLLLDSLHIGKEPANHPHCNSVRELVESAVMCPLCTIFLRTVLEDLPDPLPTSHSQRGMRISFIQEEMDSQVSPIAKAIVRFSYTGPTDGLSNRYFQIDAGEEWTTTLPGRPIADTVSTSLVHEWLKTCGSSHR